MENQKIESIELNDIIKKINNYTKISRERDLTEEEKVDREKYRKMYLEIFKKQVRTELEKIEIVD